MKTTLRTALLVVTLLAGASTAHAQSEPLNIFGYFQATYDASKQEVGLFGHHQEIHRRSFGLQQANLFLNKNFSPNLNAFLNFEVTNSFSSTRDWGSFSLEEAWAQYRPSQALQLKGGMLIPVFNNLNEIKNRTPLLPYIRRPIVYESTNAAFMDLGDFVPERAFLQVSGTLPVGQVTAEYAAHVGNSEHSFLTTNADGASAMDSSLAKAFGGRVGLRYGSLKAGVSATRDHDNVSQSGAPGLRPLGTVPRTRLGADVSAALAGFTLEGEVIHVGHDVDVPGLSVDKLFYYGTLLYDVNESFYGFAGYSHLSVDYSEASALGLPALPGVEMHNYTVGGGYRPSYNVVLKVQYDYVTLGSDQAPLDVSITTLGAALSVLF